MFCALCSTQVMVGVIRRTFLLLNPASKLIGVRHFCHVSLKMKAVNFHHSRLQISGFRSQQNKQADDTKEEYSEPFKTNIDEETKPSKHHQGELSVAHL